MNSGKTTHLIQVAYNYEERGMHVLILKPNVDKKGGEYIIFRLGVERKADIIVDSSFNIYQNIKKYQKITK